MNALKQNENHHFAHANCNEMPPSPGSSWVSPRLGGAAAVIDVDNIVNRGPRRPRSSIKIGHLGSALHNRGVGYGRATAFYHRRPGQCERQAWTREGVLVAAVNANVDSFATAAFNYWRQQGIAKLILVAGDEDYLAAVNAARASGIFVEVWARYNSMSEALARAANCVELVDDMLFVA